MIQEIDCLFQSVISFSDKLCEHCLGSADAALMCVAAVLAEWE